MSAKAISGFTVADVMAEHPCHDEKWVLDKFNGRQRMTYRSVLLHQDISTDDAQWLLLRDGWLPDSLMRRYAAICAAIAMGRYGNDDERSWAAVDVALGVADGTVDDAALAAAWAAAWAAAGDAARAAAWSAAREWQSARLLEYAYGRVDLGAIKESVTARVGG